jgi:hypothetical protein
MLADKILNTDAKILTIDDVTSQDDVVETSH